MQYFLNYDNNPIIDRIRLLRNIMNKLHIDFYLIPSLDEHHNEYIPKYWQRLKYITNFSGSNGTALIGLEEAYLWTDSRYFLQAKKELFRLNIFLKKNTIYSWIKKKMEIIKNFLLIQN